MAKPEHLKFQSSSNDLVARPSLLDSVSDDIIVAKYILSQRPVTSPQNIWAFWHSGWHGMSTWRQRIMIDWVRRQGPNWHVRILDNVKGSPYNIAHFIAPDLLPECLKQGRMQDPQGPQHISDIVRLPLLFLYGGVWMDTGLMLLRDLEDICWDRLCDPADPFQLFLQMPRHLGFTLVSNVPIATLPGNIFLQYWHSIYLELWKDTDTTTGMSSGPLLSNFPPLSLSPAASAVDGQLSHRAVNDYIAHMLCFTRLIMIEGDEFSGFKYWCQHCRVLDMIEINPLTELVLGKEGISEARQYYLLGLPRVEPLRRGKDEDPDQLEAERLVECTLREGCMKKLSSIFGASTLSSLWSANEGADVRAGTWGEYLRWGRIHLVQKNRDIVLHKPGEPGLPVPNRLWKVGLVEAVVESTEVIELDEKTQPSSVE